MVPSKDLETPCAKTPNQHLERARELTELQTGHKMTTLSPSDEASTFSKISKVVALAQEVGCIREMLLQHTCSRLVPDGVFLHVTMGDSQSIDEFCVREGDLL